MNKIILFFLMVFSLNISHAQVIPMSAIGSGGTTNGDKGAACARAEDRARGEVVSACFSQNGNLVDLRFNSCLCKKKPGSQDDYNCHITAFGNCQLNVNYWFENYTGVGVANTPIGDLNGACFQARNIALREAQNQCSWNYGNVESYNFSNCNCSQNPWGPNNYSCRVSAYLKCRMK